MDSKGIGSVRVLAKEELFGMLMIGKSLSDVGDQFSHVIRPSPPYPGAIMLEFDDHESFEFSNVMVDEDGAVSLTYQVFCSESDLLLIDSVAHQKLMNCSPHVRENILIIPLERA
jgi:hypothetical protein